MSPPDQPRRPSAEQMARSMLFLYGGHDDDDDHHHGSSGPGSGTWAKAPSFADDPQRAAAVAEASRRDRERYLRDGLTEISCRRCHTDVEVKKLGRGYTAVQWNSTASRQCAYFTDLRAAGEDSSRAPSCPYLTDSINHAVAEGLLVAPDDD